MVVKADRFGAENGAWRAPTLSTLNDADAKPGPSSNLVIEKSLSCMQIHCIFKTEFQVFIRTNLLLVVFFKLVVLIRKSIKLTNFISTP